MPLKCSCRSSVPSLCCRSNPGCQQCGCATTDNKETRTSLGPGSQTWGHRRGRIGQALEHPCIRMRSQEDQNAIPYEVWRLGFERHVPILGARDTLFQIPGTRGGVSLGMAWQNERRKFEGQELFRFSTNAPVSPWLGRQRLSRVCVTSEAPWGSSSHNRGLHHRRASLRLTRHRRGASLLTLAWAF